MLKVLILLVVSFSSLGDDFSLSEFQFSDSSVPINSTKFHYTESVIHVPVIEYNPNLTDYLPTSKNLGVKITKHSSIFDFHYIGRYYYRQSDVHDHYAAVSFNKVTRVGTFYGFVGNGVKIKHGYFITTYLLKFKYVSYSYLNAHVELHITYTDAILRINSVPDYVIGYEMIYTF